MTIENFAAGESVLTSASFSPNPVLFWVKSTLTCTEKRVTGRKVNTFAGVIPVGSTNVLFPLKQVAAVSVETKVKPISLIIGALLVLFGLSDFSSALGILLTLVGIVMFVGGLTAALVITNSGGGRNMVPVTLFEKSKLEEFARTTSQHLLDL